MTARLSCKCTRAGSPHATDSAAARKEPRRVGLAEVSMPYHTVIPVSGVDLEPGNEVQFAGGFVLGPVPQWVRSESMLENLSKSDQKHVENATVAFAVRYDAAALGDPDPNWPGPTPRAIQESKYDAGVLANLSLWLARPSPAGFTVVVHGPEYSSGPLAQRVTAHSPLLCHPQDVNAQLTLDDLARARFGQVCK